MRMYSTFLCLTWIPIMIKYAWVKWSHEYNKLSASVFIMRISGFGYMVG